MWHGLCWTIRLENQEEASWFVVVGFTIRELKGYGEMPLAALLSCQLKNLELLDSSSELDLFSLHYVFVPKINKHLNIWKDGWVTHKLSSEAQNTPL